MGADPQNRSFASVTKWLAKQRLAFLYIQDNTICTANMLNFEREIKSRGTGEGGLGHDVILFMLTSSLLNNIGYKAQTRCLSQDQGWDEWITNCHNIDGCRIIRRTNASHANWKTSSDWWREQSWHVYQSLVCPSFVSFCWTVAEKTQFDLNIFKWLPSSYRSWWKSRVNLLSPSSHLTNWRHFRRCLCC